MIKLDNNYTIDSDSLNVILRYEKEGEINKNTGKPKISRAETYHANLEQALTTYIDKRIKDIADATTDDVVGLFAEIQKLKQEVIKTVKDLNP